MFGFGNFKEKHKGKKIEKESIKKEKSERKYKGLESINYGLNKLYPLTLKTQHCLSNL